MKVSFTPDDAEPLRAQWPSAVANEWCQLHVLIDRLTDVQHRVGTPLEQPGDMQKVRDLGEDIRLRLEQLQPWMEETSVS
ncbi:MAG TPA: hypothetical protein VFT72_13630 [Opitutaceae bacterium]|nr:hypothetical protein [Opitutaceae bacterium]